MAIVKQSELEKSVLGMSAGLGEGVKPEYQGFLKTSQALLTTDFWPGSVLVQEPELSSNISPKSSELDSYNPFDDVDGSEPYLDKIAMAPNEEVKQAIIRQYEKESQSREAITAAGGWGVAANMGINVFDPINFVPVLGATAKAKTIGSAITTAAGVGAVATAAQESILQATQVSRTLNESAVNIAAGTMLSGLLGGGIQAVKQAVSRPVSYEDLTVKLDNDLKIPDNIDEDPLAPQPVMDYTVFGSDSASAAKLQTLTIEDLTPSSTFGIGPTLSKGIAGGDKSTMDLFNTPIMRVMNNSKSTAARFTMLELSDFPLRLNGNVDGKFVNPLPVNRMVSAWQAARYRAHSGLDESFTQYRLGRSKKSGDVLKTRIGDVVKKPEDQMTFKQFSEEVSRAIRNNGQHPIKEVQAAAMKYNQEIFHPVAKKMKQLGRLPEDFDAPEGSIGYLMRAYDRPKIRKNPNAFKEKMKQWIKEQSSKSNDGKFYDDKDFEVMAVKLREKILNLPEGRNSWDAEIDFDIEGSGSGLAKSLKGRKLTFNDAFVEEFTINDIELLTDMYTRSVIPDLALIEKFGTADENVIIERVTEDYRKLIAATKDNSKEMDKIKKQQEHDIRDIQSTILRIRNKLYEVPNYSSGRQIASVLKNYNVMTKMGGVVLSSLPDISRLGLARSTLPVFKDSLKIMAKTKLNELPKQELRNLGVMMDMALDGRAQQIMETADDVASGNKFIRNVSSINQAYMNLTGLPKWNEVMEGITGIQVNDAIYKATQRIVNGTSTNEDLARLAENGIDKATARVIYNQFRKHGFDAEGIRFGGIETWDIEDPFVAAAAEKFKSAIQREVETVVISPGLDKPLWLSGTWGSVIGQFKSFGYASIQKSTLLYAQRLKSNPRDFATIMAMSSQIGMGVLVTYIKLAIAGRLAETAADWGAVDWIAEGVDRSGVLGIIMDFNNIAERASGNRIGISAMLDKNTMSRYARMNTLGFLLGASFGAGEDAFTTLGAISGAPFGDIQESDLAAARRLIPFQNHTILRGLFDEGENSIINTFDIPKSVNKNSKNRRE